MLELLRQPWYSSSVTTQMTDTGGQAFSSAVHVLGRNFVAYCTPQSLSCLDIGIGMSRYLTCRVDLCKSRTSCMCVLHIEITSRTYVSYSYGKTHFTLRNSRIWHSTGSLYTTSAEDPDNHIGVMTNHNFSFPSDHARDRLMRTKL